jgi:hypothetical protein
MGNSGGRPVRPLGRRQYVTQTRGRNVHVCGALLPLQDKTM